MDYLLAWYPGRLSQGAATQIARVVLQDFITLISVRPIRAHQPQPGPEDILDALLNAGLEVVSGRGLSVPLDHQWRVQRAQPHQDAVLTDTLLKATPEAVRAALRELAREHAKIDRVIILQYFDLAELNGGVAPSGAEVAAKLAGHRFMVGVRITERDVQVALLKFRNRLNRVA